MSFMLVKHALLALSLCFLLHSTVAEEPSNNAIHLDCLNNALPRGEKPADLPQALTLEKNYKLVVRYTDLILNTTAKITESDFTDSLVLQKEQAGVEETFIVKNGVIHYKEGQCSVVGSSELRPVYNIAEELRTLFNNTGLNLAEIFDGLSRTKYDFSKINPNPVWVDGVEAVSWLGCINQTENSSAIEVGINFVGAKSMESYSDYRNPKVSSVRIVVFKADNWTSPVNVTYLQHYILSVVELEHTKPTEKMEATQVPRGLFCSQMNSTKLPSTLPTRFETEIEYSDTENNLTDRVNLMYDGINRVVSFSLDFDRDTDIPYVQNTVPARPGSKARVFLDFNSGYEYTLSKDGRICTKVNSIQKTWESVIEINGTLVLRNPTSVFFNNTRGPKYYGGQVVEGGVLYDLYVSKKVVDLKTGDYIVEELLFTVPGWNADPESKIHSIIQYHKNVNHTLTKKTITRFNSLQNNSAIGTSWSKHSISPCMIEGQADNFFFLKLADVSMSTLQTYGYENVESALAGAISKTANISVLRISHFLLKTVNSELLACFLLGEKNNGTPPAPVRHLVPEKTVSEVRDLLNGTLQTQKMIVSIVTDDLKPVQVTVTGLGLVSTAEHTKPLPIRGYSSGSMFILGIFAYIFGACTCVAAYVFYTKRQAVRGIAYQVFE